MPRKSHGLNVVPFRPPESFTRLGIDWTRAARTERERLLREGYLTYETSCGANGLVSVLLLAVVSQRQGAVADDLQAAADFAEVMLGTKLHTHREDALQAVDDHFARGGTIWS